MVVKTLVTDKGILQKVNLSKKKVVKTLMTNKGVLKKVNLSKKLKKVVKPLVTDKRGVSRREFFFAKKTKGRQFFYFFAQARQMSKADPVCVFVCVWVSVADLPIDHAGQSTREGE